MECWLVTEPTVQRLDLDEGSWVDVVRGLVPRGDEVHDQLLSGVAWQQGQVFRYERWIDSPRQMAAYPPGTQPAIDEVDAWLRKRYGVRFTAPALALYRNERDSVAFHRDREARLARRHGDRRADVRGEAAMAAPTAHRTPQLRRRRPRRRPRLLPVQRRPPGDGRGDTSSLAPRRPEGAGSVPNTNLRAVALHVSPRQARHQPVVLRGETLQQVVDLSDGSHRPRLHVGQALEERAEPPRRVEVSRDESSASRCVRISHITGDRRRPAAARSASRATTEQHAPSRTRRAAPAERQRLQPFDDECVGEPAALAHRLQAEAAAGPFQLAHQGGEQAGP